MADPRKSSSAGPAAAPARTDGARVGRVVAFARGEVRVELDGDPRGPLRARVASTIDDAALEQAA